MRPKNQLHTIILISLVLSLLLASCSFGPSATPAVVDTTVETVPPIPGSCLVGTWSLTDFTAYITSFAANIGALTNGDFTLTGGESSGKATFVFNADNTAIFSAENFTQTYVMTTNVGDTPMEIPLSVNVNGTSTSNYFVEDDKLNFSNQDNGDILITVDVMGSASTMDQSLFGQPDTVQLYQYSCVDANTLSLKVIAIEDMELDPMILTRIP